MQLTVINQNNTPKFLISDNLISSSASKLFLTILVFIPSSASAFLSKAIRITVITTEKQQNNIPIKVGKKNPLSYSNKIGVKTELRADPNLEAAIFNPKAKAKSLLANH